MAKVKFGALMTDARGKLGGHVFSKNRAGSYLRTKVTPVNPQTSYQTSVRALFGAISSQWSGLSQAVRDSFNGAVADWATTDIFGDLKNPSGKALFQRLNNQAQAAGLAAVVTLPAKVALPDAVITGVTMNVAIPALTLTGAYSTAGTQVVVFATAPQSAGTKFVKSELRQIYAEDAATYVAADAQAAYAAKFGAVAVGQNIFVGAKYVATSGQASPLQLHKAVISA